MPIPTTFERIVIAKGVYVFTLTAIEVKASSLKRVDGSAGGDFWVWKWRGKHARSGEPAKLETTTGSGISKKDSALKTLLTSAYPEITFEEMKEFNTDEMVGKTWEVSVGIAMDEKGDKINRIIDLQPSTKDAFSDED
jgi:hypothetical protein